MSNESEYDFKQIAPFILLCVFLSTFLVLVSLKYLPFFNKVASIQIVSFDVIKYSNAQRAIASTFLKKDADSASASEILLRLPERAREVIAEVAGADAIVVVKQSVVQGTTVDITDEVLKKLGLPINVPTSDSTSYIMDVAPTILTSPPAPYQPRPIPGEGSKTSSQVLP